MLEILCHFYLVWLLFDPFLHLKPFFLINFLWGGGIFGSIFSLCQHILTPSGNTLPLFCTANAPVHCLCGATDDAVSARGNTHIGLPFV